MSATGTRPVRARSRASIGNARRAAASRAAPDGSTSSTSAPATVHSRPASRSTTRSPGANGIGVAKRRRANRAVVVQRLERHLVLAGPDVGLEARPAGELLPGCGRRPRRRRPSSPSTGPAARARPRVRAPTRSTPVRFRATRVAGAACSACRWAVSMPRTRTRAPVPPTSSTSPTATAPPTSVPVTTVPAPRGANTRSTQSRGRSRSAAGGADSQHGVERGAHVVEPATRDRVAQRRSARRASDDRDSRSPTASRAASSCVGLDRVAVRQHDEAVAHTEQLEDHQVFFALRHPSLACRHHEEHHVHRTDAREHVLEKPHVSRHVDEADLGARRERGEREAEIDREAARLLFGEAIGIGAREREHQRRLAVVDVTRRRDYPHDARSASASRTSSSGVDRAQVAHEHALVDTRDDVVFAQPGAERVGIGNGDGDADRRDRQPRQRPAARDRFGVDDLEAGDRAGDRPRRGRGGRRPESWPSATTGSAVASPDRYADATDWRSASVSLSARIARASGWRAIVATASVVPTMIPACGPPSSLSPEKVTSVAPASIAWRTPGSSRNHGGRWSSHGVVSSSSPEPASTITGGPSRASSSTGVDSTNPTMR